MLFSTLTVASMGRPQVSPEAAVTMAGAIIKSKHVESTKKYNRKDCPVCKGKGWYMSGDNILKINCIYCEPSTGDAPPVAEKPDPQAKKPVMQPRGSHGSK